MMQGFLISEFLMKFAKETQPLQLLHIEFDCSILSGRQQYVCNSNFWFKTQHHTSLNRPPINNPARMSKILNLCMDPIILLNNANVKNGVSMMQGVTLNEVNNTRTICMPLWIKQGMVQCLNATQGPFPKKRPSNRTCSLSY